MSLLQPKHRLRVWGLALGAILLFIVSPFIPVVIAGVIAHSGGCALDEGSAHPCQFLGNDVGETLYTMGVMGWLGLVTIPAGGLLLILWMIWVGVSLLQGRATVRR